MIYFFNDLFLKKSLKTQLRMMAEAYRSSTWKAEAEESMSLSEDGLAVEQITDQQVREMIYLLYEAYSWDNYIPRKQSIPEVRVPMTSTPF